METFEELERELELAKIRRGLCRVEVKCQIGSREDLGRPTATPLENKRSFMAFLKDAE
ncbi:MAG: hypothetical protein HFI76_03085 [Lachnospiraceae bacterium]|nr:hypothetical protein [Lachnospiraceae bacterium]